jgi:hypothetical protein
MPKVGLYALCDTIPLCIHKIRFRFSNQRAHILFYSFKLVPLNLLTPTSLLHPAEYQQIDSTSKIFRAGNKNATSKFRMARVGEGTEERVEDNVGNMGADGPGDCGFPARRHGS